MKNHVIFKTPLELVEFGEQQPLRYFERSKLEIKFLEFSAKLGGSWNSLSPVLAVEA